MLRIVEDLYELTCKVQPETANEKQFLAAYLEPLTSALETFRKNRRAPIQGWKPFRNVKRRFSCA